MGKRACSDPCIFFISTPETTEKLSQLIFTWSMNFGSSDFLGKNVNLFHNNTKVGYPKQKWKNCSDLGGVTPSTDSSSVDHFALHRSHMWIKGETAHRLYRDEAKSQVPDSFTGWKRAKCQQKFY